MCDENMRRVLKNWDGGYSIGGLKVSNLRYADDTTILASSEDEIIQLLERLAIVSKEYRLILNKKKTNLIIVDRANNNRSDIK